MGRKENDEQKTKRRKQEEEILNNWGNTCYHGWLIQLMREQKQTKMKEMGKKNGHNG